MPELPEMEAWRRALDGPVSAFPIAKAGPAHIATLKTFDPPLSALEGRRLRGSRAPGEAAAVPDRGRRARPARPPDDRRAPASTCSAGEKRPEDAGVPARVRGRSGAVLTEAGKKKRAGVWLLTPEAVERSSATSGRKRTSSTRPQLGEILAGESRRLHSLLRDQRVIAGIGRAWANEILHAAKLSPYALSRDLGAEDGRAPRARRSDSELERGLELRERGANDARTYRVHRKLGEPCYVCGTPIAQVDFEEHTIYYCPECQTGGRVLKDRRLSRLLR